MKNKKPILRGGIGSIALLTIYFGIVTIANSFSHAIEEFIRLWYWISLLVIGFGSQVGLYSYIRMEIHARQITGATVEVATAGGVSTTSMIACCAHHITDVLPIVGLSAAVLLLNKFQILFIIVGILSNLIGVTLMLKIIQQNKLYGKHKLLNKIMKIDMKRALNYVVVFSVLIFSIVLSMSV